MAIHALSKVELSYHKGKLGELTPDSKRLWGEMNVTRMLCHLRTSIEQSIDPNAKVKIITPPIIRDVLGWLLFDVFTNWPKGKFKAPKELTPETNKDFAEEKRLLFDVMDRFAAAAEKDPDERHVSPVLGSITLKRWAHAHGVHLNHHYRQFGLL